MRLLILMCCVQLASAVCILKCIGSFPLFHFLALLYPQVSHCTFHTQDMGSWTRDGIAGLQSVVLYSLPELDGEC